MNKEDRTYCFPAEVAEQLLCSSCKLYISCGPVKIAANGNSICGRCSPLNCDETYIQNILFETSMSKFKFPCSYKTQGCKELLLFGETIEHERVCPYRSFLCPVLPYNNCMKDVNGLDLFKHFEEYHKNLLIINGQFELDLKYNSQCNFLMKHNEVTFIVQYNYDAVKNNLFLNAAYFSRNAQQKCRYRLQIINGVDFDVAVNCKEYACRVYDSPILNEYNSDMFIISDYLRAINNPSSIIIKITLIGNVGKVASPASLELLEKYRCYGCECISLPPLYNSQCSVLICTGCKSKYGGSTEIKTETFPCYWRDCSFVGNGGNIKEHIEKCEFRTYLCHIDTCKTGYYIGNDMINHMLQHGTYCPDPNNVIIDFYKNSNNDNVIHFTILKNVVIVFTTFTHINGARLFNIKGFEDNINYQIRAHFEHDHCLLTSKRRNFAYNSYITIFDQKFPPCFKTSKYIRGIFSITFE